MPARLRVFAESMFAGLVVTKVVARLLLSTRGWGVGREWLTQAESGCAAKLGVLLVSIFAVSIASKRGRLFVVYGRVWGWEGA